MSYARLLTIADPRLIIGLIIAGAILLVAFPMLSWIAALPYRSILWIVRLFGLAPKHQTWAVVYDSVTKRPIDPAYVTIKDTLGREVATTVTDLDGRFGAILPRGIYTIDVQKGNYVFPSQKVSGQTVDGKYTGLYFGGTIDVVDAERSLAVAIPMDPIGEDWNQSAKQHRGISLRPEVRAEYRHASQIYFLCALIFSGMRYLSIKDLQNTRFVCISFGLVLIAFLQALFQSETFYQSVVIDQKTKLPVQFARVKIFTAEGDHQLAHKTTTFQGEFVALVPPGRYYATIEQRNADGTYTKIFTSSVFFVRDGYVGKKFKVRTHKA